MCIVLMNVVALALPSSVLFFHADLICSIIELKGRSGFHQFVYYSCVQRSDLVHYISKATVKIFFISFIQSPLLPVHSQNLIRSSMAEC